MAKPSVEAQEIYHNLRTQFKRIENYSDDELEATIAVLGTKENYALLNFIDAYFERRKRRLKAEAARG